MSRPLASLEHFFERIFERPAARLFQTSLEPVQVQRRLERAMDAGRESKSGHVPDRFSVYIHPADLESLGDLQTTLEGEFSEGLLARSRQRGYRLAQRPTVSFVADPTVGRGEVAIEAGYGPPAPPAIELPESPIEHASEPPAELAAEAVAVAVPAAPSEEPPAAHAYLAMTGPGMSPHRVPVGPAMIRIGRGAENDLVIADSRASRQHGTIALRHGLLVYTDLDSTNGSFVNGTRVAQIALGPGDVVRVGDTTITIEPAT